MRVCLPQRNHRAADTEIIEQMSTRMLAKQKCPFCDKVLPLGKEWVDHVIAHVT